MRETFGPQEEPPGGARKQLPTAPEVRAGVGSVRPRVLVWAPVTLLSAHAMASHPPTRPLRPPRSNRTRNILGKCNNDGLLTSASARASAAVPCSCLDKRRVYLCRGVMAASKERIM